MRNAVVVCSRYGAVRATVLCVALLLLSGGGASASNPWQLRCASMPRERPLPSPLRSAALRFFPWVHPPSGLRSGPVYLVALSSRTAISRDGDSTDRSGYYLHRALIAIAPTYAGAVTLTGRRLGARERRATLGFSLDGATRCTVKTPVVSCGSRPLRFANALRIGPRKGWRIVPTELRIGRTACFQLTAAVGPRQETIPLAVPGPDYGTSGW
jgi:hypothetical protein